MWRCGKCLSQGGARPWEARSDVVAHGTERLVQLVFPDTQRSPDPYGGDLLSFDELADRRLRYAQVVRDLWHVHEAVGQVARFSDVEEAADPRFSAPVFSRLSASLSDIAWGAGYASRGIWRMSSFMGWQTASRLASRALRLREAPRSRVFWTGQAERYLLGGVRSRARR